MKHYICLEGDRIIYALGKYKGKAFFVKQADLMDLPKEDREQAVLEFLKKHKLVKKKVVLSIEHGVFFRLVNLPSAAPKAMRAMVRNELTYSMGNDQELVITSVPYRKSEDGASTTMLTYSIRDTELNSQLALLTQAGVRFEKIYVGHNCLGQMAKTLFPETKAMILVEAHATHLSILLIENGYCVLGRNIRLNVKQFCDTQALDLLYEELAEQITKALQFHATRNKEDVIETIILLSDVIPDVDGAAREVGRSLNLPCYTHHLDITFPKGRELEGVDRCHHALAAMVKRQSDRAKEVDFMSVSNLERRRTIHSRLLRYNVLVGAALAVNMIALGGVGYYIYSGNCGYQMQVDELQAYISDSERQAKNEEVKAMKIELTQLKQYKEKILQDAVIVNAEKVLQREDFEVIRSAMIEGMQYSGVRYIGRDTTLEMDLVARQAEELPELVQQIKDSSHFRKVSYISWQQVADRNADTNGYGVTVQAELRKERHNEAE